MSVAEFISLLLFAIIGFALHLVIRAYLSTVSEIEEHESRRSRIKGVIRNLAIILSLIAPPLIILWKVALSVALS